MMDLWAPWNLPAATRQVTPTAHEGGGPRGEVAASALMECFGCHRLRAVEYARVRSGSVQGYQHECVETHSVTSRARRGQGMARKVVRSSGSKRTSLQKPGVKDEDASGERTCQETT